MAVICMLDGDRDLQFTKHLNCTWAGNTNNEMHEVNTHLNKAEDFISYTNLYYGIKQTN
ncbi:MULTISPECIES: hypothetical protein [Niastella]|uniref:Uncharacterized protein n=1 Tax=Niastella soli TaxID=2821487 RepID=A0ABS3Z3B2_9BACT|nr:hypothetical protein [Niastella soli]MBO9204646.1 hypothetical protein [Niastella soli]